MRVETQNEVTKVFFRQSWINEYYICPERARLSLTREDESTNEAAALGTSLHAGIEAALTGGAESPIEVYTVAEATLVTLEPHFVYDDLSPAKSREWLKFWVPMLRVQPEFLALRNEPTSVAEVPFCVQIAERAEHGTFMGMTTELWLEGTIDAVKPYDFVVDWKTTGRPYQRWEKQRWAIQPTVYAEGARQLGLIGDRVDFRYVVFEKRRTVTEPEVVAVTRGPEHTVWLTEMLWRVYDGRKAAHWALNDQHALCSEKWCPNWSECKGLYIAPDFNAKG